MSVAEKQQQPEAAVELRELRSTVDRLEKTVSRFVVLCERLLASNDQESRRTRDRLAELHPDMGRSSTTSSRASKRC